MKKKSIHKRIVLVFPIVLMIYSSVLATPEYAEKSKQRCLFCHIDKEGGGTLTKEGLEFAASGYAWPSIGGYRMLVPVRKSVRLGIGFFHIIGAFLWFGTILYVHLMLRPGYAASGLPRSEVALGLISMTTVGVSGALLMFFRINSLDVLYISPWGRLLSLKIIIYIAMIASALFTVLFVGPKLKKGQTRAKIPDNKIFCPLTLKAFDGKNQIPSYIAFRGKVYDVSKLNLWKNGIHMKHLAGNDHTDSIGNAPHGEEKLKAINVVGTYDATLKPPKTFAQKAFYCIAYTNLFLLFVVLFVIAYWRWGI